VLAIDMSHTRLRDAQDSATRRGHSDYDSQVRSEEDHGYDDDLTHDTIISQRREPRDAWE
jgi:hypothetical protein